MSFDTGAMSEALQDVTNGDAVTSRVDPQALGWAKPKPFSYGDAIAAPGETGPNGTDQAEGVPVIHQEGPAWAHNAERYEWKDEYGDVGPEIPALEKELFHNQFITRQGGLFGEILKVKVVAEAEEKPAPIDNFKAAGLHPAMVSNIEKCNYEVPTPIQAYTIPSVLMGRDLIATAQTGSGKTAAFLIPTISKLMGKAKKLAAPRPKITDGVYTAVRAEPLILVVAPTRELCCQIFDEARRLCYRSMLRPCVAYGGAPIREQRAELGKGCDILVATPGRLVDFMNDSRLLSLNRLRFTIIDEADEMLHDDWEDEMEKIMGGSDANEDGSHQYLLFSATFNKSMRRLAKKYLDGGHVRVRIGRSGAVVNKVAQKIIFVDRHLKQKALYDLLIDMPPARTMVFVRSKKTADFVDDFLFNQGLPSTSIHSDRTQREREDAIRAFRSGEAPILVTTGVAARGIDVRNVLHIVNFDLPAVEHNGEDEYIHRIGRTARIGNGGLATSFYNDADEPMAEFLVKTLVECKQEIPDFLEQYKPAEDIVEWDDDSGVESEAEAAVADGDTGGDAWGAGDGATIDTAGDAWGAGNGDTVMTPAQEFTNNGDQWGQANAVAVSTQW